MNQDVLNLQPLTSLAKGQSCYINKIELSGLTRRRIFDLGIIPGTWVTCVRRSPSGNPTAYCVRGATIALRNEDAVLIKVTLA